MPQEQTQTKDEHSKFLEAVLDKLVLTEQRLWAPVGYHSSPYTEKHATLEYGLRLGNFDFLIGSPIRKETEIHYDVFLYHDYEIRVTEDAKNDKPFTLISETFRDRDTRDREDTSNIILYEKINKLYRMVDILYCQNTAIYVKRIREAASLNFNSHAERLKKAEERLCQTLQLNL